MPVLGFCGMYAKVGAEVFGSKGLAVGYGFAVSGFVILIDS